MSTPEPPQPVIAATIRFLRLKAELSQEELAQAADIHPTEISRLENGLRNPKWGTMKRLAKGLGVRCSQMVALAERFESGEPA
jgi:transcriptional regulator with XRE-family HTH domain